MPCKKRKNKKIESEGNLKTKYNKTIPLTQARMSTNNNNTARYTINWFVNNENTSTSYNMTAEQAYDHAIPGEAILPLTAARWHVVMRRAALDKMAALRYGESFKVCYQEPHPLPGYDTEVITITREPVNNV